MKEIDRLEPRAFTRFCMSIGAVPSSYIAGLTIEEQLLWFCSYLEKTVIPAVNNNGEAVTELQNLYLELKDYVDNYFDNLDVQQEINNKLDDMAESGELADIIAQYLQLAGVLAYDTKADMKAAENLVDGSICKTLGDITYNDGLGAFYKVREILNTDVVDDNNIVALTDPDLVAEKIYTNYLALYDKIIFVRNENDNGDCTIIKLKNKTIMIDTSKGVNYTNVKDTLDDNDITKIDCLIISHYHADHYENIDDLINDNYIDNTTKIYLPRQDFANNVTDYATLESNMEALNTLLTGYNTEIVKNNPTVTLGKITVDFFNTADTDYTYYSGNTTDYNDYSVCCNVKYNERLITFTGDISSIAENYLYTNYDFFKNCDILKLEHHGRNVLADQNYLIQTFAKYGISCRSYQDKLNEINFARNFNCYVRQQMGSTLYTTANENIEFIIDDYILQPYKNYSIEKYSHNNNDLTIYVDNAQSLPYRNGTSRYPFYSINEAIGFSDKIQLLIDGKSKIYTESIIKNSPNKVTFKNITSKNINIRNSIVDIDTCNFTDDIDGTIIINKSKVEIKNCTFDTSHTVNRFIIAQESDVFINNSTISNKTYAMFLRNSDIACDTITGTSNTVLYHQEGTSHFTMKGSTVAYTKTNSTANTTYNSIGFSNVIEISDVTYDISALTNVEKSVGLILHIANNGNPGTPDSQNGWCLTLKHSDNTYVQIYVKASGNCYIRQTVSGSWRSWKQFVSYP